MTSINRVLLLGNLTRDPELRYIQSGAAVCQFGLGLTRRWTNGAGEKRSRLKVVAQRVTFLYRPAPAEAAAEAAPDWVREEG